MIAAELATRVPVRALILESTFTHVVIWPVINYACFPPAAFGRKNLIWLKNPGHQRFLNLLCMAIRTRWSFVDGRKVYSLAYPPRSYIVSGVPATTMSLS